MGNKAIVGKMVGLGRLCIGCKRVVGATGKWEKWENPLENGKFVGKWEKRWKNGKIVGK